MLCFYIRRWCFFSRANCRILTYFNGENKLFSLKHLFCLFFVRMGKAVTCYFRRLNINTCRRYFRCCRRCDGFYFLVCMWRVRFAANEKLLTPIKYETEFLLAKIPTEKKNCLDFVLLTRCQK